MNNLQLCQSLSEKAGILTGGPSTVVSQTGEMLRVVHWVSDAWEEIQNRRKSWRWMRKDIGAGVAYDNSGFPTVAGTRKYSLHDLGLDTVPFGRFWEKSFRIYLTSAGQGTERHLVFVPYDEFRDYYLFGSIASIQSLPIHVTVAPDNSILLGPIPDNVYTVHGELQLGASRMAADADIPAMPSQYHMLIVWSALLNYSGYESAQEGLTLAKLKIGPLLDDLEDSQLDAIESFKALA